MLFELEEDDESVMPASSGLTDENAEYEDPNTDTNYTRARAQARLPSTLSTSVSNSIPIPPLLQTRLGTSLPSAPRFPPPAPISTSVAVPRSLKPGESELMTLVAADYPSHRGAWRDGKAWELFDVQKHKRTSKLKSDIVDEETENDFNEGQGGESQ